MDPLLGVLFINHAGSIPTAHAYDVHYMQSQYVTYVWGWACWVWVGLGEGLVIPLNCRCSLLLTRCLSQRPSH